MKAIEKAALERAAKERPKGYLEDVLSFVVSSDETHVFIENDEYYLLRDKYNGKTDFPLHGPGTHLHRMLARFGIRSSSECACRSRMIQMNKWGCDGCEENFDTIIEWLKQESSRRGIPFIAPLANVLVRRAIAKARKAGEKVG